MVAEGQNQLCSMSFVFPSVKGYGYHTQSIRRQKIQEIVRWAFYFPVSKPAVFIQRETGDMLFGNLAVLKQFKGPNEFLKVSRVHGLLSVLIVAWL